MSDGFHIRSFINLCGVGYLGLPSIAPLLVSNFKCGRLVIRKGKYYISFACNKLFANIHPFLIAGTFTNCIFLHKYIRTALTILQTYHNRPLCLNLNIPLKDFALNYIFFSKIKKIYMTTNKYQKQTKGK